VPLTVRVRMLRKKVHSDPGLTQMSIPEFVSTVLAIPSIVDEAASPDEAWRNLRSRVGARWNSASEVLKRGISRETKLIVAQLREVFAEAPPPSNLQLLYFGLFTGVNPDTSQQVAGYYVSGTTRAVPLVDSSSELSGGILDYLSENKYLWSPILQRIKEAALANESQHDEYDYALMLCTASILSFFAVRQLDMRCRIVVGFDSGDAVELPTPLRGSAQSLGGRLSPQRGVKS
jgi:hypothetical protein